MVEKLEKLDRRKTNPSQLQKFLKIPKNEKKICGVSKNQNNYHHRGHAPFSECPVNSRSKRKTFYRVVSD
jgi:hypothetical protein